MKVYLIGMSGIGMQGLAVIAKNAGDDVSGWDDGKKIDALEKFGIFYQNFIPNNTDLVVYSSAIKKNHPLIIEANKLGIKIINRTDFLIQYVNFNKCKILVAGAHGKTTTTSLFAYILDLKSYLIGGIILDQKYAAKNEQSDYSVIELDESDGSFLKWYGDYKILLNFDFEHMDFFKTKKNAILRYREFAMRDLETTKLIIEENCKKFLKIPDHKNIITFGKDNANYMYSNLKFTDKGLNFDINGQSVFAPLFGEHNASNFTAVYAFLKTAQINYTSIENFPGVKKRMELIEMMNDFKIYSDYGHHPQEINAVLQAFFMHKNIRPAVIIEPHRYSRMQYTWKLWPQILKNHRVFVTALHTANEQAINGIDSENFVKYLQGHDINASYLESIENYTPTTDTICFSAGKLSQQLEEKKLNSKI